jgi:predicted transposase/invertase (TIGR01784 family)
MEELLLRRFTELDREEVRKMFGLQDIRKSRVWQQAHETGIEKGIEKGKTQNQLDVVRNCLTNGMSAKEIAGILKVSLAQVRRLIKKAAQ